MKKTLFLSHTCLIFTGIFFNLDVYAEMYKWADDDGNIHYSQSPPIDSDDVEVIKPPPRVDTEKAAKALEKQKKNVDKLREDRITKKEDKQKQEEEALAKQEKCQQARKRFGSYNRPRVNVENSDGSLRVLSEEERQSEIEKSKESVKKLCNK